MVIRGLKQGSIYVFQVRARTVAGFGRYSGKLYFQTMTEGERSFRAVIIYTSALTHRITRCDQSSTGKYKYPPLMEAEVSRASSGLPSRTSHFLPWVFPRAEVQQAAWMLPHARPSQAKLFKI